MAYFILRVLIAALGLWLATEWVPGITVSAPTTLILAALLLGVVNAIVRPIVVLLTLPVTLLTLGLFLLVINIAMIGLAEWIAPNFSIDGFWTYVGVVVILWLVNWIADALGEMFEGEGRRVLA